MYYLVAKKFVIPWTILSACLVSILLYLVTGSIKFIPQAHAASEGENPSAGIVSLIEKMIDVETDENQAVQDTDPQAEVVDVSTKQEQACEVDTRYPDSVRQWCGLISEYSDKNGLDPDLIAALIWQESGGNPVAYSKSGAVGLMQVMPRDGISASFQCPNGPCFKNRPSIEELKDPEFNIAYGTGMLSRLHQHHGNLREALKSYGPMDVGYYYADIVLNLKAKYGD